MAVSGAAVSAAFDAVLRCVRTAGMAVAGAALGAIVTIYSYEVVSRYFFGAPTRWSAEFVSYLLCVLVFAAMPNVTATGGQVAVTVLVEALGSRARRNVGRAVALVGAVVCAAMAVFAFDETVRQFARGVQMVAAVPVQKWWISAWIVAGFALSALEFLLLFLRPPVGGEPSGARLPEI